MDARTPPVPHCFWEVQEEEEEKRRESDVKRVQSQSSQTFEGRVWPKSALGSSWAERGRRRRGGRKIFFALLAFLGTVADVPVLMLLVFQQSVQAREVGGPSVTVH